MPFVLCVAPQAGYGPCRACLAGAAHQVLTRHRGPRLNGCVCRPFDAAPGVGVLLHQAHGQRPHCTPLGTVGPVQQHRQQVAGLGDCLRPPAGHLAGCRGALALHFHSPARHALQGGVSCVLANPAPNIPAGQARSSSAASRSPALPLLRCMALMLLRPQQAKQAEQSEHFRVLCSVPFRHRQEHVPFVFRSAG